MGGEGELSLLGLGCVETQLQAPCMKSSQIYKGSEVQTARVRQLSEGKCDTLLAAATFPLSFAGGKEASLLAGYVKPGFHMIVPIAPVVSKYWRRSRRLGRLVVSI